MPHGHSRALSTRCEGDGLEGVRRHRVAWASAGQEHTQLMKWEWGQGPSGFGVCEGKGGSRKSGRWGSAHGIGRAAADARAIAFSGQRAGPRFIPYHLAGKPWGSGTSKPHSQTQRQGSLEPIRVPACGQVDKLLPAGERVRLLEPCPVLSSGCLQGSGVVH